MIKHIRYIAVAWILVLMVATLVLFVMAEQGRVKYEQLKAQEKEILLMSRDYQKMQERSLRIENAAKGESRGISAAISDLLSGLGMTDKLQSVKNLEQKKLLDLSRQDAEMLMKGLSMNEAVNLLYVIEKGNFPLSLRTLEMKRTFESSDVLDLRLVLSYFQKK